MPALRQADADLRHRAAASDSRTKLELPLLGQIPLYPRVMEGGDTGAPIVAADPESSAAQALAAIAQRVTEQLGAAAATR